MCEINKNIFSCDYIFYYFYVLLFETNKYLSRIFFFELGSLTT